MMIKIKLPKQQTQFLLSEHKITIFYGIYILK